jgi:hypothetical protein
VLALPLLALAALLATGRAQAYWTAFAWDRPPRPDAFASQFLTALLWMAACTPLIFAAWELGRQHTSARRLGFELWVGLRDVVRHAFGLPLTAEQSDAYVRPPRDKPGLALALGGAAGLFFPAFFLALTPPLRTQNGLLWLLGAGFLMGSVVYCHRRAVGYLVEEPGRWDLLRHYRLLNPNRYAPAGRTFVRWQLIGMLALMLWWLVGGAVFAFAPLAA